jgi:hypothetical protein
MKDHIAEVDKTVQLTEPKLAGDYQVLVVDPPWNQGKPEQPDPINQPHRAWLFL